MTRCSALLMVLVLMLCGLGTATATASDEHPASADRRILVMLRLAQPHFRPGAGYMGDYGNDAASGARRRLASRIAAENRLKLESDWAMPLLGVDCFVMSVPDGRSPEKVAESINGRAGVAWSQPLHEYRTQEQVRSGPDPLWAAEPVARQWHLADLHKLAMGRNVVVAVVDSRVDTRHPDLVGQFSMTTDLVNDGTATPERHGTAVAGLIAAREGNGIGIAGVAPAARIMALRACWPRPAPSMNTVCDTLSLAKAVQVALVHRADIINMSLSGPRDLLLSKFLELAMSRGVSIVAAFDPAVADGGFPASQTGVIAVAREGMVVPSGGVYVAPGTGLPTTKAGGGWYLVSGSSFAAANVSGLMALIRERKRASSSHSLPALVGTSRNGGAVDALASLSGASCRYHCARPAAVTK